MIPLDLRRAPPITTSPTTVTAAAASPTTVTTTATATASPAITAAVTAAVATVVAVSTRRLIAQLTRTPRDPHIGRRHITPHPLTRTPQHVQITKPALRQISAQQQLQRPTNLTPPVTPPVGIRVDVRVGVSNAHLPPPRHTRSSDWGIETRQRERSIEEVGTHILSTPNTMSTPRSQRFAGARNPTATSIDPSTRGPQADVPAPGTVTTDVGAGVKDGAGDESLRILRSEPLEMASVVGPRRGGRLDLDGEELAAPELDHDVDRFSTSLAPGMVQPHALHQGDLGPQLRHDEGVDGAAEQVGVGEQGVARGTERRSHEGRVDHVALGGLDESVEVVGRPGRDALGDEECLEECVVAVSGLAIDGCRVVGEVNAAGSRAISLSTNPGDESRFPTSSRSVRPNMFSLITTGSERSRGAASGSARNAADWAG
jgi:hypothetical protein